MLILVTVAGLGECLQQQEEAAHTHLCAFCVPSGVEVHSCARAPGLTAPRPLQLPGPLRCSHAAVHAAAQCCAHCCAMLCTLLRLCCAAQAFHQHQSKEGLPQEALKRLQTLTLSTPSILGLMVGAAGRLSCARLPSLALLAAPACSEPAGPCATVSAPP